MSKLKMITAHNNERAIERGGKGYILTICSTDRKIVWQDCSGNSFGRRVPDREEFERIMSRIKQWLLNAGPDDATYYGQFKSVGEFDEWCAELLCEDCEVKWDVICEYSDGSLAAYVCTDSREFPEPLGETALMPNQTNRRV